MYTRQTRGAESRKIWAHGSHEGGGGSLAKTIFLFCTFFADCEATQLHIQYVARNKESSLLTKAHYCYFKIVFVEFVIPRILIFIQEYKAIKILRSIYTSCNRD